MRLIPIYRFSLYRGVWDIAEVNGTVNQLSVAFTQEELDDYLREFGVDWISQYPAGVPDAAAPDFEFFSDRVVVRAGQTWKSIKSLLGEEPKDGIAGVLNYGIYRWDDLKGEVDRLDRMLKKVRPAMSESSANKMNNGKPPYANLAIADEDRGSKKDVEHVLSEAGLDLESVLYVEPRPIDGSDRLNEVELTGLAGTRLTTAFESYEFVADSGLGVAEVNFVKDVLGAQSIGGRAEFSLQVEDQGFRLVQIERQGTTQYTITSGGEVVEVKQDYSVRTSLSRLGIKAADTISAEDLSRLQSDALGIIEILSQPSISTRVIAIDTSSQRSRAYQMIMQLIRNRLRGMDGILLIEAKGNALSKEINDGINAGNFEAKDLVVIASAESSNNAYSALRDQGATVASIEDNDSVSLEDRFIDAMAVTHLAMSAAFTKDYDRVQALYQRVTGSPLTQEAYNNFLITRLLRILPKLQKVSFDLGEYRKLAQEALTSA